VGEHRRVLEKGATGTLLPEASTATNDINKVRFEFVPYTGLWWDTAMNNAQKCPGIVKSFLLQSGVDDDISHHDFFTMLLRPYLEHKKRNDRVYGGPQAPGIHKNAWKMPVLDVSKPFEFCSRPHLDVQSQPVGVNVNVCMSLVHYVLVQGLGVTKDWNRKAHDNASFVSCVHMRNVSHMSLGLISLLLHTCCCRCRARTSTRSRRRASSTTADCTSTPACTSCRERATASWPSTCASRPQTTGGSSTSTVPAFCSTPA